MGVRACYFLPVEYFHVVFIPQPGFYRLFCSLCHTYLDVSFHMAMD